MQIRIHENTLAVGLFVRGNLTRKRNIKHRVKFIKIVLQGRRFADVIAQFISEIGTMITFFALNKALRAYTLMLCPLAVVNLLPATIGTLNAQLHADL